MERKADVLVKLGIKGGKMKKHLGMKIEMDVVNEWLHLIDQLKKKTKYPKSVLQERLIRDLCKQVAEELNKEEK